MSTCREFLEKKQKQKRYQNEGNSDHIELRTNNEIDREIKE